MTSENGFLENKYGLENFQGNLRRLARYLLDMRGKPLVAVFDIGTKAARVIVAPKVVPSKAEEWSSQSFFNDGQVFNLGTDFSIYRQTINTEDSKALEGTIYFINTYKRLLLKGEVSSSDINVVGTAVFRWMKNKEEVLAKIEKETGLRVFVLDKKDEALFSSLVIDFTQNFGAVKSEDHSGKDHVLLLIDQGGGSTEISYFSSKQRSIGNLDSINALGTVALQDNFFTMDENQRIDPANNRRKISAQFKRITEFIDDKVNTWPGFTEIIDKEKTIHAFGMGTALSKCFSTGNNYRLHNSYLSIEKMQGILAQYCESLETANQQVRTLYSIVQSEERAGEKNISKKLVLLYGLPVYQKILEKFGLSHLRYAGYGLRYGVYLGLYHYKLNLGTLQQDHNRFKEKEDGGPIEINPIIKRIFISYNHKDIDFVEKLKQRLESCRLDISIDTESLRFTDVIEDFIKKSIKETDFTLSVVSINSLKSPWVMHETMESLVRENVQLRKRLVPIFIDKAAFDNDDYVNIVDEIDQSISKLESMIVNLIGKRTKTIPLDIQKDRLYDLKHYLPTFVSKLRDSLVADFSTDEKVEENFPKLVKLIDDLPGSASIGH